MSSRWGPLQRRGLRTYVDDYDDTFPYVGTTSGKLAWSPGGVVWEQPLTPYVKEWSFRACPEAGATTAKPYTYFFSRQLSGESWGAVKHPALCLMVGDWVAHGSDPGPSDPSTTWDIARTKKAAPAGSWLAGERHAGAGTAPGGAVYASVDGHVKLLRRPDILPGNTVAPPPGIDVKPSFYP